MNLDELVAIDIHAHAEVCVRMAPDEAAAESLEARGRYFRYAVRHPTIAQMAANYRGRKMGCVVFAVERERGIDAISADSPPFGTITVARKAA